MLTYKTQQHYLLLNLLRDAFWLGASQEYWNRTVILSYSQAKISLLQHKEWKWLAVSKLKKKVLHILFWGDIYYVPTEPGTC